MGLTEIWAKIDGYGNAYSVSSSGRVMRTSPRVIPWRGTGRTGRKKPFKPSMCKAFINRGGYPQVRIGPTGHQKTVCVHRLVAIAFIPNPLGRDTVNHIDGDKTNNNVNNLEWCTRSENLLHAVRTGLQRIELGSKSPNAKLTEPEVMAIREDDRIARLIAADYGVSTSTIYLVKHRKIWQHI